MRNKFPGVCYRCKIVVDAGAGHFERHLGGWRVQHVGCAIKYAGTDVGRDPKEEAMKRQDRERRQVEKWKVVARGTGKAATKARQALRGRGVSWGLET